MHVLIVGFDDMFAYGKSKPRAAFVATSCGVCAIKAFKDPVEMFFFNTYTIVTDLHQHMQFIYPINAGYDVSVRFAVLGGILNEVNNNLLYFFFICKNNNRRLTSFFESRPDTFYTGEIYLPEN